VLKKLSEEGPESSGEGAEKEPGFNPLQT
jgi:hypothetical protein